MIICIYIYILYYDNMLYDMTTSLIRVVMFPSGRSSSTASNRAWFNSRGYMIRGSSSSSSSSSLRSISEMSS